MFKIVDTKTGRLRVDYTIACAGHDSAVSLYTLVVVNKRWSILKVPGRWFMWEIEGLHTNVVVI
jgi:hypothetical protein